MVSIVEMHGVHELANLDLNLVVALDALLAERHVTRAATRLGLTQSATSHALARLRELLGDPILVRGARGQMLPTPLAERIAPQLRRTLAELAHTLRGEAFDPQTSHHTFHLGTSDYVELVLLPTLTARIRERAPNVDLWVHAYTDDGTERLATGALDLVIGPVATDHDPPRARSTSIFQRVLFDDGFRCITRASHPSAGAKLTLARYCELPHLLVAPRGKPGSFVDDALAKVGRVRRVALAVPHFLVVPHLIAATDLVATLASRVAALFADSLGLVTMPPPLAIPKFRMAASWHERSQHDAAHRWLRDQVIAAAAEA